MPTRSKHHKHNKLESPTPSRGATHKPTPSGKQTRTIGQSNLANLRRIASLNRRFIHNQDQDDNIHNNLRTHLNNNLRNLMQLSSRRMRSDNGRRRKRRHNRRRARISIRMKRRSLTRIKLTTSRTSRIRSSLNRYLSRVTRHNTSSRNRNRISRITLRRRFLRALRSLSSILKIE